ncbi:ECF transporter S component [Georgenia sp. TF02-10]|uniref:ECF transporter S component n=1 Tax=Georgenia sp. TF02-10 TaxID=2917725 RepID=UPI001FA6EF56|nr:ECF transporter S component [Georgenia sp. TF02-10]UNX53686.1 ECF transporter S component [Georgenia sp. TF02-10]
MAFLWPLLAESGATLTDGTTAPLVLGVVVLAVLAVLFVGLADGGIDVKAIAVLGLLAALGAVLRPLAAGTAGVETVFVTIILGGRVLGPGFGFVLGSTTIFASALLTGGVGPWLPFQMLGASWVGLGAGLLPGRARGGRELAVLAAYGAVASLGYGLLMNLSFWPFQLGGATALSYVPGAGVGENLHRFVLYSVTTSLGWDLGRAITTAVGVLVLGRPVLATLRRAARRARFGPPAGPAEPARPAGPSRRPAAAPAVQEVTQSPPERGRRPDLSA